MNPEKETVTHIDGDEIIWPPVSRIIATDEPVSDDKRIATTSTETKS